MALCHLMISVVNGAHKCYNSIPILTLSPTFTKGEVHNETFLLHTDFSSYW